LTKKEPRKSQKLTKEVGKRQGRRVRLLWKKNKLLVIEIR